LQENLQSDVHPLKLGTYPLLVTHFRLEFLGSDSGGAEIEDRKENTDQEFSAADERVVEGNPRSSVVSFSVLNSKD
jgi:hypothetical protein